MRTEWYFYPNFHQVLYGSALRKKATGPLGESGVVHNA
jgi:hypothetical protein